MFPREYVNFIKFLSAAATGSGKEFFSTLPAEERSAVCSFAEKEVQGPLFYYCLQELLPEHFLKLFHKQYIACSADALKKQFHLKKLYDLFAQNHIRFAPLKGADIAFRCYPASGIRYSCDWDIWVHPEDCKNAVRILLQDGWICSKQLGNDLERFKSLHHFPPFFKNGQTLELHWTLPNFSNVTPEQLWSETIQVPDCSFMHLLTPELNMLLLCRHISLISYDHTVISKLLLDAYFVMQKTPVDWERIRMLAKCYDLPYPGDIFGAFPEFFSPEVLKAMGTTPELSEKFRQMFYELLFFTRNRVEQQLIEKNSWSLKWIWLRLYSFRPSAVIRRNKLAGKDRFFKLIPCYFKEISFSCSELWKFLSGNNKKLELQKNLILEAEKNSIEANNSTLRK